MQAKTQEQIISDVWIQVLQQPPLWAFSKDEIPALWDRRTYLGISFDPKARVWAIGHITVKELFVPSAGPFNDLSEAAICLVGFVANTLAAKSFSD